MELDEIMDAFLQESDELLTTMEETLLSLETDQDNPESLNAIFRAAHTIKGSAGMFGFNWIVEFTHVLENLLEQMRSGLIRSNKALIEQLLKSKDYLNLIIKQQVYENKVSEKEIENGKAILAKIKPFLKEERKELGKEESLTTYEEDSHGTEDTHFHNPYFHISIRLNQNNFINALDPMSFIKYLKTLGDILFIKTIIQQLPDWKDLNPEHSHLGFEIKFKSNATLEEVKKVFEFLEFDSSILVLPPHPSLTQVKEHIQSLPEDEIFLGNVFREMESIDQDELIQILEAFQGLPIFQSSQKKSTSEGTETKSKVNQVSSTLRVDSNRIDHLINKVGELVVSEANLSQLLQTKEDTVLLESLHSVSRLIHEIREISLKLRMVPIGDNFNKYHRIVRDLGNDLNKKVLLHIQGGDTELDKTVMERLADPMVHIVRNAIDHGLETPEERLKNGKNPEGNLHLNAYHDTGSIVIEIWDDGRGINHEKVLKKAWEKGIVPEGQSLSNEEIERLLFHAGFSTAEKVSNISGRGVGLDVVQKNIESLRGFIQVKSEPGKGTKFLIRLPLTLAIIDGFLVGAGPDLYVIPLDMVRECVEFKEDLKTKSTTGKFFNLRGSILPFVRLDEFFHMETNPGDRENIVITEYQGQKFGLVVDRLYGEFQTVIKPLAKVFQEIRGIGGSTTLGDGKIALILDVADIHFFIKEKQELDYLDE
ncbi:MAG: chemotaxis protein CheA [Leptospira sp.]|nr:chemotaxis protein CheA [Leptospira sp.]